MNCKDVEALISEYIESTCDEVRRRAVETHLASCAACRAEADALKAVVKEVSALPSLEVPLGFSNRVMAEIREKSVKPRFWEGFFVSFKVPVRALTLLLVAGLAVYLYRENPLIREEMSSMAPPVPSVPEPKADEKMFQDQARQKVQKKGSQESVASLESQSVEKPRLKKEMENVSRSEKKIAPSAPLPKRQISEKEALRFGPSMELDSKIDTIASSKVAEKVVEEAVPGKKVKALPPVIEPRSMPKRADRRDMAENLGGTLRKPSDYQFVFRPHPPLSEKEFLKTLDMLLIRLQGTYEQERPSVVSSADALDLSLPAARLSEFKQELAVFGVLLSKKNGVGPFSENSPQIRIEGTPPPKNTPAESLRVTLFLEFEKIK